MTRSIEVRGVEGLPEIEAGADLAALIASAAADLRDGDVVVVTSKIVSKAEGRLVAGDRESAIDAETLRVVATRGDTRIVETRQGFVLAAAGVDASNVPDGTVALLPEDPDRSAARIRAGLRRLRGVTVAVLVTDTFGRPWRNGLVDVAIGAAGIDVLDDHRGRTDAHGHTLEMTVTAVADEIASAAELVKGKLDGIPVAIVRGLTYGVDPDATGARPLVRSAAEDMFRLGTNEAKRQAMLEVSAALAADDSTPWHHVVVGARAKKLLDAIREHVPEARDDVDALELAPLLVVACVSTTGSTAAGRGMYSIPMSCRDVVRELLDLPPDWDPLGLIAIGY